MKPTFFAKQSDFRRWLQAHHGSASELLVGYYKVGSGRPSITWPQSVDEALCFGWIDGIRRTIDAQSYSIRFTPRRARSNWSAVNIKRARELKRLGAMRPAGWKAFLARADERSAEYSYEQRHAAKLEPASERRFRANKKAWSYFQGRPPSYRKAAIWWVVSAKKAETRQRRLAQLIKDSENGRTIPPLTPPSTKK